MNRLLTLLLKSQSRLGPRGHKNGILKLTIDNLNIETKTAVNKQSRQDERSNQRQSYCTRVKIETDENPKSAINTHNFDTF